MKKFMLNVLIIILVISLAGCVNRNADEDSLNGNEVQSDVHPSNVMPQENTPPDDYISSEIPMQPNNDFPTNNHVLDYINVGTVNLASCILGLNTDLELMEKEYGPIIDVDWIEGAYYKHEKLDLWVAYFSDESFVVNYDEALKGVPYTILENEKNAPILRVKCQLSDLFDEPDNLTTEEFALFAEKYKSLE